ncbi:MAG: hypothetical protein FJ265_06680 [Planctomycetes bacterium]|nr:hypothetical protein [Planctomycetota bacterium]
MRSALLLLLLALGVAAVAFWARGSPGDEPPPAGAPAPDDPRREPGPAGPTEPGAVARQQPAGTREAGTALPVPQPEPVTPEAAPAANVELLVRSATTHEPVAAFRWAARMEGAVLRGTGGEGFAGLALPAAARVHLTVEAAGYTPGSEPELAVPPAGAAPRRVGLFLSPAAAATGVTLTVYDPARMPVAAVRVDAFALTAENRDLAWHLGTALWSRRRGATDGRYVLSELAPGDYGVRVLATDAEGTLLPLLPCVRTFALTGSNGFVEDVTLEPGCLPELELVTAAGAPLDPARGAVTLGLRLPGGPAVSRYWVQQQDGRLVRALDQLPGPGVVWPAEAVAPGRWQLDVLVDEKPALQQQIVLRAGERQRERLVVP